MQLEFRSSVVVEANQDQRQSLGKRIREEKTITRVSWKKVAEAIALILG
jgi:hypothetical protein